jgi:hypothetical protein
MGSTIGLRPADGTVSVQLPGSPRPQPLDRATTLPVGSIVDTTRGAVALTDVRAGTGSLQSGKFWGGKFRVDQRRGSGGVTDITLVGGGLTGCSSRGKAIATAAGRRRSRHLWGSDHHGSFRTRGSSAAAEVRGTVWLTQDTCAGTGVRVKHGAVAVRDFARRRTVVLRAGQSYFAHRQVKRGAR